MTFFRDYVAAYIDCRKPLIALVNGPALGVAVTVFGKELLELIPYA